MQRGIVTIACPNCGSLQDIPALPPRSVAACHVCRGDLESTVGRSIPAAFACAFATLLLLFPTNVMPLLRIDISGFHSQTLIAAGIAALWGNGWLLLAGLSAILVVGLPFLRFGLLSAVLGVLQLGRRPPWIGPAFRWALWLDLWAMLDVYLLASFVGYYRLSNIGDAHLTIEAGGACFIAAAMLTMLSRVTLDARAVWRAIGPEGAASPGEQVLSCLACDMVLPAAREGGKCPRCGATLSARLPNALSRTTALLVAAFVLLFPANIYPMNISEQLGTIQSYTIFTGVKDLFQNGLWPLGIIIFCTSILIPFAKIVVIAWCVWSVKRRQKNHIVLKTKLFRLVAELGRWSKTDPFTIVFFVPLLKFGVLATADAGWGATAFILMSVFTMAASNTFDTRLMWDAAQMAPP